MPSFSLYPKKSSGMMSPLAKGSTSSSPRASDAEETKEGTAVEEEEEKPDILDMRDHDEMIKSPARTATHTASLLLHLFLASPPTSLSPPPLLSACQGHHQGHGEGSRGA